MLQTFSDSDFAEEPGASEQTPRTFADSDFTPTPGTPSGKVPGLVEAGNIDLDHRPRVRNADGSISTVRSIGVNIDGQEILLPTVSDDGRILSTQQAIDQYKQTGKHLGKFSSAAASDAYAQALHEAQAKTLDTPRTFSDSDFSGQTVEPISSHETSTFQNKFSLAEKRTMAPRPVQPAIDAALGAEGLDTEAMQEPISKKVTGYSLSDLADSLFPETMPTRGGAEDPNSPSALGAKGGVVASSIYGMARSAARTASGIADWMQSPEALAATVVEAVSAGSATPIVASILGGQFATQGGRQALKGLESMRKDGINADNAEQFLQGLAVAEGGLIAPAGVGEAKFNEAKIKQKYADLARTKDYIDRAKYYAGQAAVEKETTRGVTPDLSATTTGSAFAPTTAQGVSDLQTYDARNEAAAQPNQAARRASIAVPETKTPDEQHFSDEELEQLTRPQAQPAENAPQAPAASPAVETAAPVAENAATVAPEAENAPPKESPEPIAAESGNKITDQPQQAVPPLLREAEALKDNPIRLKEPDVVRNSEFSNYAAQIRSLAERNLPILLPDVDEAIRLHDEGETGNALVMLEKTRQELHGAGRRLAEAAAAHAGIELPPEEPAAAPLPEGEGQAAATPRIFADSDFGGEAQPPGPATPRTARKPLAPIQQAAPTTARDRLIWDGAESEMQAWAESVRHAQEQLRRGQSAMTMESNAAGKEIEEEQQRRANAIRSLGVKEGSPLEGMDEAPDDLASAIEDRGGSREGSKKALLYRRIQKAFRDAYEETHGSAIDDYLGSASDEQKRDLFGDEAGTLQFERGESKPTLGENEEESKRMLVAGRKTEQLREGQQFDSERLVNSELFGGRGGPQGFLSTDERGEGEAHEEEPDSFDFGASAKGVLDSKISESDARLREMIRAAAGGGTLGANLPFDLAFELAKNGAMRIARGTVKFAEWSAEMIAAFGEHIRPILHDIYDESLRRVQAAKDAGIPPDRLDAVLSGNFANGGKYVKNEPLDFRFGKNDKGMAKNLREEFAGVKNAQIVRGNHLAADIRRMVPDPVERRAMFWYKAANGDLGMIRQALTEKQFEPYKAELTKALDLSAKAKGALDEIYRYYAEAGAVSREVGTIRNVRENYQNRIYQPEPPKDFVKTETGGGIRPSTRHAQSRVFNTEFDAVRGGKKFATTDVADALSIHNEEMARVNTSRKLADSMSENGVGQWLRPSKVPSGWKQVGTLEKNMPLKDEDGNVVIDKRTGNQFIDRRVFAAPEGVVKGLRAIADPDFTKRIDALRGIQKYQGLVKTVDLSYSFFHHFTMAMQALYQGSYRALTDLPIMSKVIAAPEFREMETDFARHGGMTSNVAANQDILRNLAKKEPGLLSKIANLPGVKQAMDFTDKNSNFLFGKMQRLLKVQDYASKVSNWVADHPNADNAAVDAAKRAIARQNNAAYGGLNWEAMGMTKSNLSLVRLLLLAPDWSISNGQLAFQASGGGLEGKLARAHYLRALVIGMALTEGVNMALTGHTTDKNPAGHKLEVEIAPGVWVSFFRGGVGDLVKYASNIEQNGPLKGTAQFAQGKLAPIARTAVGTLAGTEYSGRPISAANRGPFGATADYGSYIARNLGPIPFGAGNVAKYLSDDQKTATGAAGIATGLARYAPINSAKRFQGFITDTADALSKASVHPGAPKPRKGETPATTRMRDELAAKLIDERVGIIVRRPSFGSLPLATQQKQIRAAISEGHQTEEFLSGKKFPSEAEGLSYLSKQIQNVDQRRARRTAQKQNP